MGEKSTYPLELWSGNFVGQCLDAKGYASTVAIESRRAKEGGDVRRTESGMLADALNQ
jgi:hypothetical protein